MTLQNLGTRLERWKYHTDGLFWDANGNWKRPTLPRKIIFWCVSYPIFWFNQRFHEYLEVEGSCAICGSRGYRLSMKCHPQVISK